MRIPGPHTSFVTPFRLAVVVTAAILIGTMAVPTAQRRRASFADQGLPVATNTIMRNPDAYMGQLVIVGAGVEQMLSKTTFVVDQRKASGTAVKAVGAPMLVIAPDLQQGVDVKQYLTVRGLVLKYDPVEIATAWPGYAIDLPPDVSAKYKGQPVLLARSVVNNVSAELAKRPLTPAETKLTEAMQAIGPAFTALRTAAQGSEKDAVMQHAAKLGPAFAASESVWESLGQVGAAQWSREAQSHAAALETNAASGNWDGVRSAYGALNQLCQNCHNTYREREDETFRIKRGSI